MPKKLRIKVPATSANIGPGFDTLGLALSLCNEFEISLAPDWLVEGCKPEFCGPDNLLLRSYRYARELLGRKVSPVQVKIRSKIPVARGLGSSAALSVGGVAAALLLDSDDADTGVDVRWQDDAVWQDDASLQGDVAVLGPRALQFLLDVATVMEGHPDNAVPAVCGGFCAAFVDETSSVAETALVAETASVADKAPVGHVVVSRNSVPSSWRFHALVPPFELETKRARAVLPATVTRTDAVFNIGRAVMVSQALTKGDVQLLALACEDKIHQPYRKALIPGYDEIRAACVACGADAFWLSGSGPTLMAVTVGREKSDHFSSQIDSFLADSCEDAEARWIHRGLRPDNRGVRCVRCSC